MTGVLEKGLLLISNYCSNFALLYLKFPHPYRPKRTPSTLNSPVLLSSRSMQKLNQVKINLNCFNYMN